LAGKTKLVIDIGKTNIKLLEASMEEGKINVKNFSIIPTPRGSFADEMIVEDNTIAEEITKERKNKGFTATDAYVVISGDKIITREVILPKVPEKELNKIVRYEVEQYFPVDLSNYIVDYRVLNEVSIEDETKYKIYVAAAPEKMVESVITIAKQCKLYIEVVDIMGNVLSKLLTIEQSVNNSIVQEGNSVAIIDLGATYSYIVINCLGVFQFGRGVWSGSSQITDVIASALGIDMSEAERIKIEKGERLIKDDGIGLEFGGNTKILVRDISKVLNSLITDISKIIEYYQSRNPNNPVTKIYLTGGGANLGGICDFFKSSINVETEILKDFKCIKDNSKKNIGESVTFFTKVLGTIIRLK